jgi:hypothetical protein
MQLKGFPVVTAQFWSAAILRRFPQVVPKAAEELPHSKEHRTPNIESSTKIPPVVTSRAVLDCDDTSPLLPQRRS